MLAVTKVRDLLVVAAVASVAMWMLSASFYGSLPPVRWYAGASLYPVAAVVVVLAFVIRARIKDHRIGDGHRQLHPISAARAVAFAKASALVGAASTGVWLGLLAYLGPQRDTLRAAGEDLPGVVIGVVGGVLLTLAALWLEHNCRTPEDPPEQPAR